VPSSRKARNTLSVWGWSRSAPRGSTLPDGVACEWRPVVRSRRIETDGDCGLADVRVQRHEHRRVYSTVWPGFHSRVGCGGTWSSVHINSSSASRNGRGRGNPCRRRGRRHLEAVGHLDRAPQRHARVVDRDGGVANGGDRVEEPPHEAARAAMTATTSNRVLIGAPTLIGDVGLHARAFIIAPGRRNDNVGALTAGCYCCSGTG